jgi:hypothetical protein
MSAKVVLLRPSKLHTQGRVFHRGQEVTVPDEVANYLRENLDGHFEIDFTAGQAGEAEAKSETKDEADTSEDTAKAEVKPTARKGGVKITKGPKAKTDESDEDAVEL